MMPAIDTDRLRLVACDAAIYTALLSGKAALATLLNVTVPNRFTNYGNAPLRYAFGKLQEDPADAGWWTYLPIFKPENVLIGTCGYSGKPDEYGMVEIGYEISKPYRRRGLGTEVARALIDHAFADTRVETVQARTLARINASAKILRTCGLVRVEELTDPRRWPALAVATQPPNVWLLNKFMTVGPHRRTGCCL